MRNPSATFRLALAMVAFCSSLTIGAGAVAQESPPVSEITVQSTGYIVSTEGPTAAMVGKTEGGIPIRQVELIQRVRFEDLDLATDTGAKKLRNRIRAVAAQGCKKLAGVDPPLDSESDCVATAVSQARPQIEAAIAEARQAG